MPSVSDRPAEANGHLEDDDIDYSDIEARYAVQFDEGFDNVIVIDGVPVIDDSRQRKLFESIQKRFKQAGIPVDIEGMNIPYGEDGKSKGYIFIEMNTAEDAAAAIRVMDGHAFDRKHRFSVNRFTDIERLANVNEEYVEPPEEEFKPREHLRSWLADQAGRDQLVVCRGDDVQIAWHNRTGNLDTAYSRTRWTESYVQWSPLGTYLATFHRQGVALWGGTSWEKVMRFAHPGVRLIDFSPSEKYLVTWSQEPIVVPDNAPQGPAFFSPEDEGNSVAVWDVRTGHLLRTFPVPAHDDGRKMHLTWPFLKWSGDDKYVGRVTPGQQISIYETPGMGLLDKKSIKIEGVVDFEWCPFGEKDREVMEAQEEAEKTGVAPKKGAKKPRDNMIAYWTPEVANQPARVSLMSIPTRTVLRSKNLFSVSDCKIHWQNQGDFLCVKVDRHTKTKKTTFCNLEIFRVRDKDCPVEVIELKDPVTAFGWEPRGDRFAIISSNDPNLGNPAPGITIKTSASFFALDHKKSDFRLLKQFDNRTSNTIYWSPRGRHVVLATLGSGQKCDLEWFDLDYGAEGKDAASKAGVDEAAAWVQAIGSGEHYGVTDIEWDPSGRFVCSSASVWRHQMENGYAVWDFRGQELQKQVLDRFKQILWRPRPRTLLSKEQQKAVRRNLKEFSRLFEEEDQAEASNVSAELKAHRRRLVEEWQAWRRRSKEAVEAERERLGKPKLDTAQRIAEAEAQLDAEIEEWVEEVLEETEEVVG